MTDSELPPLTFPASWDASEHRRAARTVYKLRVRSWWDRLRLPFFVLWLAIVITPGFFLPDGWSYLWSVSPWVALAFLWLVSWALLWPRLSARNVAKNDPDARAGYTRVIDATGLHLHGATSRVSLTWERIHRVVETPEFFLFYFGPKIAYYLPKRAVPPDCVEPLRERLRQLLAPSKLTLGANAS